MKKYLKEALVFAIYGLLSGVFFREFTKFNGFNERTMLGMAHPHILMLGFGGFLIIALFYKVLNLEETKMSKIANIIYCLGILIASVLMMVRGSMEVAGKAISDAANGAISGVAGIGHVAVAVGIIMYLIIFIKADKKKQND